MSHGSPLAACIDLGHCNDSSYLHCVPDSIILHSVYCYVGFDNTALALLQALDVWAMGVTLYCFVYGKASVNIFCTWVTGPHRVMVKSSKMSISQTTVALSGGTLCVLSFVMTITAPVVLCFFAWLSSGIQIFPGTVVIQCSFLVFFTAFFCFTCSARLLMSTYWLCTTRYGPSLWISQKRESIFFVHLSPSLY